MTDRRHRAALAAHVLAEVIQHRPVDLCHSYAARYTDLHRKRLNYTDVIPRRLAVLRRRRHRRRYGVSRKQVYNWLDLAHSDTLDRLPSILVPPATRLFDLEQTDAWIRTHSRWSLDMDQTASAS